MTGQPDLFDVPLEIPVGWTSQQWQRIHAEVQASGAYRADFLAWLATRRPLWVEFLRRARLAREVRSMQVFSARDICAAIRWEWRGRPDAEGWKVNNKRIRRL